MPNITPSVFQVSILVAAKHHRENIERILRLFVAKKQNLFIKPFAPNKGFVYAS